MTWNLYEALTSLSRSLVVLIVPLSGLIKKGKTSKQKQRISQGDFFDTRILTEKQKKEFMFVLKNTQD